MGTLRKALVLAPAWAALVLAGCGGDSSVSEKELVPTVTPVFAPSKSKLPFPTDILFSGTVDGSINVPGKANTGSNAVLTGAAAAQYGDPQTALNTMDGFGTTSNITASFTGEVKFSSLKNGVRVYKAAAIDPASKTITDLGSELKYGVDFVVSSPGGDSAIIVPLQPLDDGSTYLVALTNDIRASDSEPIKPSDEYKLLKGTSSTGSPQLDQLQTQTNAHEDLILNDPDISQNEPHSDLAATFSFSTENVGGALAQAKAKVESATAPNFADLMGTGGSLTDTGVDQNGASIYAGLLTGTQQFLNPSVTSEAAYRLGTWKGDTAVWNGGNPVCAGLSVSSSEHLVPCNSFTPAVNTTANIPVLVSLPNSTGSCPADLPVAIYQHGITSHRGTLLALAGSLASSCTIGIAIDMPKHGILPNDPQFGALSLGTSERLIRPASDDINDCQNPDQALDTGTEEYCASGDYYVNLQNLPNAQATVRQSVTDLQSLFQGISSTNLDTAINNAGYAGGDVDESNVHFVGISLGSIVGAPFVAQESGVKTVSMNVGGGGIAKILDGSPSLEPVVREGLAANGVTKPSSDYEGFLLIAQTLLDNTDPMNFTDEVNAAEDSVSYWLNAATASGSQRAVLYQEVVGENQRLDADCSTEACPDQVVPNNVFGQTGLTEAWRVSTTYSNQISFLPGQNPLTNFVALSGTDPLAQGTAFLAQAQQGLFDPVPPSGMQSPNLFYGLTLQQVDSSGVAAGTSLNSGLVRFSAGGHSSLLDPSINSNVTTVMQTQVATFIGSYLNSGGTTTQISGDPNAGTSDQVVVD